MREKSISGTSATGDAEARKRSKYFCAYLVELTSLSTGDADPGVDA